MLIFSYYSLIIKAQAFVGFFWIFEALDCLNDSNSAQKPTPIDVSANGLCLNR
jgi:hypothetical protein